MPSTFNAAPVPVGTVPPVSIAAGEYVKVDVSAFFRDPDDEPLSYGAMTTNILVAGASISGNTMTVIGVSTGQVGGSVVAKDPAGAEAVQHFFVEVRNRAPEITRLLPVVFVDAGQVLRIELLQHFADPDGDALTFVATTADAQVAGASVSGSTLSVGGVAAGGTTITVTARDSTGEEVEQRFEVVVLGR